MSASPPTFATTLRSAISESGRSLEDVQTAARTHGVSVACSTLSFWQSGRRTPRGVESMRTVSVLEEVLELPPGSLSRLLSGGELQPAALPTSIALDEVYDALGYPGAPHEWDIRTGSLRIRVGPQHGILSLQAHDVMTARVRTSRHVCIYLGEPTTDYSAVTMSVQNGGRLERLIPSETYGCVLGVIDLGRTYLPGEMLSIRLTVCPQPDAEVTEFFRHAPEKMLMSTIDVTFDEHALPAQVRRLERTTASGPDLVELPIELDPTHTASAVTDRMRRGSVGLGWTWPA